MTPEFLSEDFLLESAEARTLYQEFAAPLPIIDYHCHLSPEDIANDRRFRNLTEIWLAGDHYKWRAMRTCGVDERFITGGADDWEKFLRWAETVPKTLRNPLYHWSHLELKRYFGIDGMLLDPSTAKTVWEAANSVLQTPAASARGILKAMRVEIVCTTDDPVDSLEHHRRLAADRSFSTAVFPAFRPDRAMAVDDRQTFMRYTDLLSDAADTDITRYAGFLDALRTRHAYFHAMGCRLSDHGLETVFAEPCAQAEAARLFEARLNGASFDTGDALRLKSAILRELAVMDAESGWTQQFHLGAMRNNNSRMMREQGPDTGYDSIGDFPIARPLSRFLDGLDADNALAKTILYNLNPADNEVLAAMIGNFQGGNIAGKMQYGAAWWFLDQMDGMTKQINALSTMGLLSQFIGMLTDSRSFLSYPRHEYFRRLLCNILGNDMVRGLIPRDMNLVGGMVTDICYHNANRYLNLPPRVTPAAKPHEKTP
jgi:glucuronate isomerase